jgi:phage baseplate assembly protein W
MNATPFIHELVPLWAALRAAVRSTVEEALRHYEARLRVIRSEQGYDFNEAHLMPGVSAAASWDGMNG